MPCEGSASAALPSDTQALVPLSLLSRWDSPRPGVMSLAGRGGQDLHPSSAVVQAVTGFPLLPCTPGSNLSLNNP